MASSYLPKIKSNNKLLSLYSTHTVTYKSVCNHDQAHPHDALSICLVYVIGYDSVVISQARVGYHCYYMRPKPDVEC